MSEPAEIVTHVKFGKGKIVELQEKRIAILFDGEQEAKLFAYPQAFGSFLLYEDQTLQEKALEKLEALRREEAEQRSKRNIMYEEQEKERKKQRLALAKKKREAKTGTAVKTGAAAKK